MIVITGATGHLGRLVIEELLKTVPAGEIVAAVRNPAKAADLSSRGIDVRLADYDRPETLIAAFRGAEKVLLISGSEVGKRIAQHQAVVDAARNAGAGLLAYTSVLHGEKSTIALAAEHQATEKMILASGLPYVFLRNGWYMENYTGNLAPALEHGAIIGSSGDGRVGAAARADYAVAAARVLAGTGHDNKIYELAGDKAFTMRELAEVVSEINGKRVIYKDLTVEEHVAALVGAGLPRSYAEILADADQGVKRGDLDDASGDLGRLIGRPTTSLRTAVTSALTPQPAGRY